MENDGKLELLMKIIQQGEKSHEPPLIGMEFEHIVVKADSLESVNYYEENGIQYILTQMLKKGFHPVYEKEYLIGLEKRYGLITLEPGGQLELSINPCHSLAEVEDLYRQFLQDVLPILEANGQWLMAIGYHPKSTIAEIPFNPKKRYQYMSDFFKGTGKYGHNMMKGTAALQVAIDYENEADFIKKYRVANFLIPVLALITDNSPIFEGKTPSHHSVRSMIWENTDPARSGIIEGVMDQSFGYEAYAQYLLQTAPIFIMKEGTYHHTGNKTMSTVLDEISLSSEAEIEHLFSMVFPDVRVKRYIEIRMGDSLPMPLNLAYGALLKGIFYNPDTLEALYKQSLMMDTKTLIQSKQQMIEKGFQSEFMGAPIGEMAKRLFEMAEKSLPSNEIKYLQPLKELVLLGKNPAEYSKELLEKEGLQSLKWCAQKYR